jgi:hypothetical protein
MKPATSEPGKPTEIRISASLTIQEPGLVSLPQMRSPMEPAEGDHAQLGLWAWNKFALPVILPLVFSSPAMSYIAAACPSN